MLLSSRPALTLTLLLAPPALLSLAENPPAPSTTAPTTSPATPQLAVLHTSLIGGPGRWDFLGIDPASQQLFIPRSTRVQILNLDKPDDRPLPEIPDTSGVHGVAVAPDQNLAFASNGKTNSVTVFDIASHKVTATLNVGKNPDAILFDPASKHILTMNHTGGDISVIDPAHLDNPPTTIPVGGKLEVAVSDSAGHAFVNVEDKNEIVQIDTTTNKVLAHWPLTPGDGPTGLAIDTEHHRLFAGCSNNKMIILDSTTGKFLASVPIGAGVDGVAFDPTLNLALSANGKDGTLTAVRETSPGTFEAVQTLTTAVSARTIILNPKTHQALLPCNTPDADKKPTFTILTIGLAP